jgi:omega-amidase
MNIEKAAESMTGSAVSWLVAKAKQKQAHILGSVIIEEDKKYFNRLIWAKPDGEIMTYDKKHLFRMAGEHKVFSAGNRHLTVEVNGWKLRTFICYDLRFPIWCRNIQNQYDAAIYIANWPAKRAHHWKLLLPARAVENQSYIIGVNRVGQDGNGIAHSGDSSIIAPTGEILFQKADVPCIHTAALSYAKVKEFRETFAAWQDADGDAVTFPRS